MSTFSTPRRRGFDLPRQEQGGLGVYGVPAVSAPANTNVAEQVSRVLASLGQTASNLTALNKQQQDALDRRMGGVADEAFASIMPRMLSEIQNDQSIYGSNDQIDARVTQLVDAEVAQIGLDSSPRVKQALHAQMVSKLSTAAYSLRDARQNQVTQDTILDLGKGLPFAAGTREGIDAIVADMRTTDPNISEKTVQGYLVGAATSLAITGNESDKAKITNLLETVDDPEDKARVWSAWQTNVEKAKDDAAKAAADAAENTVSKAINENIGGARAALESVKGSVTDRQYQILSDRVDSAISQANAKARSDAQDAVAEALNSRGPKAAEEVFKRGLENGVFTESDRAAVVAKTQQYATDQMRARIYSVQAAMLRNNLTPAEAIGQLDGLAADIEERTARAADNPYSFDAVEPSLATGVLNDMRKTLLQAADTQITQSAVQFGTDAVANSRIFVPTDIPLSSGTLTAKEQADAVVAERWDVIQATEQDPQSRLERLTRDMAMIPGGESPVIKQAVAGIPNLGFALGSEQDPAKRDAIFQDLSSAINVYRSVGAVNWEVAKRHLPAEQREVADYIMRAVELIPQNNREAISAAMAAVRSPDKFSTVLKSDEVKKAAEKSLKDAGLGKSSDAGLRSNAQFFIAIYAAGLGISVEQAGKFASESLRNQWQLRKGQLIRTGSAATDKYLNPDVLEQILLETIPVKDRDGLVLGQTANGGWALKYEDGRDIGLPYTEPLTGRRAMDLVQRATSLSQDLTGRREKAVTRFVNTDRDPRIQYLMETDLTSSIFASIADGIKSRAAKQALNGVLDGYVSSIAERESDPLNKAATIVGGRISTGSVREPTKVDVNKLVGKGIPGL